MKTRFFISFICGLYFQIGAYCQDGEIHHDLENNKFKGFSADFCGERVQVPASHDYIQNKYGKSSYFQSTFIAKYSFQKKLSGLHFSALFTYRFSEKSLNLTASETFYKTNFHHLNFIRKK